MQKQRWPIGDTRSGHARQKSSSMGRKRRWIAAFAADSERQDKETPISITARLQITFTDGERKATTIPGIGAVKFSIGPSTQHQITNANKKGHFLENKDTEILREGNCSATSSSTYTQEHKQLDSHTHTHKRHYIRQRRRKPIHRSERITATSITSNNENAGNKIAQQE